MAKAGDIIHNSATGETITFTKTAAMTNGRLLEFGLLLEPGSKVPMRHIHTEQDEVFAVTKGRVNVEVGTKHIVINPGEKVTMPKGIAHRWWNDAELTSELTVSFMPACNTEDFFIEVFRLATADKTKPNGSPTFLQAAQMCGKYNIYHPVIPIVLQKVVSKFIRIFV